MNDMTHDTAARATSAGVGFLPQLAPVLPPMSGAYQRLVEALWEQTHVPSEVLELCRLRLAQLHRSEADWQRQERALAPRLREQLSRYTSSDAFDEGSRACLAFAEVYAMDASAISDAQASAVQAHYGDAGLVLLIEALGLFDGLIRLNLLWGALPQAAVGESGDPFARGCAREQ
ncbi:MAG: hypothetical protein R3E54_17475 [Halioglobus sp.]